MSSVLIRVRNSSERETFWKRESWGVQPQSSHMDGPGLEVSRLGALGSGLRPESEGWQSQCPQPKHAPPHFTPTPRSPLQCSPDRSPVRLQGLWVGMAGCPFSPHSWQKWMTFPWGQWEPELGCKTSSLLPTPTHHHSPGPWRTVSCLSEKKKKASWGREIVALNLPRGGRRWDAHNTHLPYPLLRPAGALSILLPTQGPSQDKAAHLPPLT